MSYQIDTLRKVLTAALPGMTGEQQDAADALLAALAPPMEEPTWPGYVMARCPDNNGEVGDRIKVHARRIGKGDPAGWECDEVCSYMTFSGLRDPRPLTADECAAYGIPGECERPHAEPITDELVTRCTEAGWEARHETPLNLDSAYRYIVLGVLRAAGHPEAQA